MVRDSERSAIAARPPRPVTVTQINLSARLRALATVEREAVVASAELPLSEQTWVEHTVRAFHAGRKAAFEEAAVIGAAWEHQVSEEREG